MTITKQKDDWLMILYCITALFLLLDSVDNFPYIFILRKVKYIFMAILFVDFLVSKNKTSSRKCLPVIILLFIHTILFGKVLVNNAVLDLTNTHFNEMIVYLTFLFLLTDTINRYCCFIKFIKYSSVAIVLFLLWCSLTHFSDFVNPIYYIFVFLRNSRIRSNFGTISPNVIGFHCLIAVFFLTLLINHFKEKTLFYGLKKYCCTAAFVLAFLVMFSSASRGSIISTLLFLVLLFCLQRRSKFTKAERLLVLIISVIAVILILGNWDYIVQNSNREGNVSENLPVFFQTASVWKGMGYLESSSFQLDSYGINTYPVDIYYLYIFLSTGLIGVNIIGMSLFYLLICIIRLKNTARNNIIIAMYVAWLFSGLWQVNIFTYRYFPSLLIGTAILSSISDNN